MNIPSRFELYIENRLSDEEKIMFEKDLLQNPELSEAYNVYNRINRIIKRELYSPLLLDENDPNLKELSSSQRFEIEEDFYKFHSDTREKPDGTTLLTDKQTNYLRVFGDSNQFDTNTAKTDIEETRFREVLAKVSRKQESGRRSIIKFYTGIAAAIVVSFFAGKYIIGSILSETNKISPQKAFLVYYNPGSDTELKSFSFSDNRLNKAFLDFKRSDKNSQLLFSNQMNVSNEDYELSLLFLGVMSLERNNIPEARNYFNRALSLSNPSKVYSTWYYLSLSYLSEGNTAEAKPFLIKLSESKNPYRKKARSILHSVIQE